jgi:hypothetical protein
MLYTTLRRWLKQGSGTGHRGRAPSHRPARRPSVVPRLLVLEDRTLPSTFTVLNNADSGGDSLRTAIADAQNGDLIVFDQSLQGQTITLTSGQLVITKSLDIEGLGAHQLAVSGNHQSWVFDISGGVTVTIAGLTITDGRAPRQGGGIENVGSTLTIANDVFSNNQALNAAGPATGGAIDSTLGATLTVTHCLFLHNQAMGNLADAGALHTGSVFYRHRR